MGRTLAAGLALATLAAVFAADAEATMQRLEVDTASGAHAFKVEVMHTDAERERGLMYRKSLPKNQGMLFDFPGGDQPLQFWMKNTLIPLDMLFIDSTGRVVSVKHDAKPMDETIISSEAPAKGVLEINAGEADAMRVKPGDVVKHAMFGDVH